MRLRMNFTSMGNQNAEQAKNWVVIDGLKPADERDSFGCIPATTCQPQQACPLACGPLLSSRLAISTMIWLEPGGISSKAKFASAPSVFLGPLAAWTKESGEIYKVKQT